MVECCSMACDHMVCEYMGSYPPMLPRTVVMVVFTPAAS
jgi:hypothetical protein